MQLIQVKLKDFRCFKELTFNLPANNGLYLLSGKNKYKERHGANGIGKSTIADAICFALYGKTSQGEKSGDLLNYTSKKGYSVELLFDDGTTIKRSWNPIVRQINGIEVDDREIVRRIGMTFEQFLYAIYRCQIAKDFIDQTPNEKLSFLSNLFELDKWIRCSDICKERLGKLTATESNITYQIGLLQNSIAGSENTLQTIDAQIEVWETNQKTEIQACEEELEGLRAEAAANDVDLKELDQLEKDLKEARMQKDMIVLSARNAERAVSDKKRDAQAVIKTLSQKIERLLNKEQKECPECQQMVTTEHVVTISDGLVAELSTKEEELQQLSEAHELAIKSLKDVEAELEDFRQLQAEQGKEIANMRAQAARVNTTKAAIKRIEGKIAEMAEKQCPLLKVKASSQALIEKNQKEIEELSKQLSDIQAQIGKTQYWQKQFPLIRLSLIKEVTEALEIHFNQAFSRMGLSDYTVQLDCERELKTEGTKKEINLRIFCDDREIRYAGCSGGEKQRIRLATALGVSDMIKSRLGVNWNLMIVDEPSQGLAEEGISDMLELYRELAQNAIVILAEHRVKDTIRFDGVYNIIKQADGNSILSETGFPVAIGEHVSA